MLLKRLKKIVCLMMVILLSFNSMGMTFAQEEKSEYNESEEQKILQETLNLINLVGKHFDFDENDKLILNISDKELITRYNLNNSDLEELHRIIAIKNPKINKKITENMKNNATIQRAPSSYAGRVYIDHISLTSGMLASLGAAAYAGPATLAAAWTAVATAAAGPIGSIGGVITGMFGTAFFADMAMKIIGAIESGKGIAIYTVWAFPPVEIAIE